VTQLQLFDWLHRKPRVALLGTWDRRPEMLPIIAELKPSIEKIAEIVAEDFDYSTDLSRLDVDLALVFGGDGSILRAARQMRSQQIPVVGINFGKLGFLADLLPEDLLPALERIAVGECEVIAHLMLRCQVIRDREVLLDELGLNEVAIMAGPPFAIQQIEFYVDSELATTYSCDGLIISTPVGSTAHNLSAGGPIVRKDLQAFVISPLSPHTLTVRPVVDSADRVYEIVVRLPNQSTYALVDGQAVHPLQPADRVRVTKAAPQFQLVQIKGQGYYRTLREKLGWSGALTTKRSV
jgi:NAD+ kinase